MGGTNTVPPAFMYGGALHSKKVCLLPIMVYLMYKHVKRFVSLPKCKHPLFTGIADLIQKFFTENYMSTKILLDFMKKCAILYKKEVFP